MRLEHRDGTTVHLAYCTNVHPAEDLAGVLHQVRTFGDGVREALHADRLGLGLWLAHDVAASLAADASLVARLRGELDDHGLEVVTLNGFPYGGFHAAEVKKAVYRPDWSERSRLHYTLHLATVLAGLLPDDVERGSISTLPFAWRTPWFGDRHGLALAQLTDLADGLDALEAFTGKSVRVGLEPEPGCVVETTEQAVQRLQGVRTDRIGVCLDACHLACAFEDPDEAVAALQTAGLPVVKVQASAALHVDDPTAASAREALLGFDEPRFLHQVRQRQGTRVHARDDLDDAVEGERALTGPAPWRVHFHVPLHTPPAPPLRSTTDELDRTLGALLGGEHALTEHVEVETYTWTVLPEQVRPAGVQQLVEGIASELAWTRDRLVAHGLKPAV